ncbi:MAG: DUF4010 domain-containing protein [Planctomycetes bacterium]|nr:DUF4010 domain-containing protein [Planctomycetota bacterium]
MDVEWTRFGVALAIGALVGLERQVSASFEERHPDSAPEGVDAPAGDRPEGGPSGEPQEAASSTTRSAAPAAGDEPRDGEPQEAASSTTRSAAPAAGDEPWERLQPGGLRTFMLVALFGAISAQLSLDGVTWIFPAALLVIGGLTLASYLSVAQREGDLGLTSEVSLVLVFLLGGLSVRGDMVFAGACAVAMSVVLSLKKGLHAGVGRIEPKDVSAVLKFAVLTVIVLPILPNEPLVLGEVLGVKGDPLWWHALSLTPRKIWWMVVLISGVSFVGYVLGQALGAGRGLLLTGAVGGLVSSTAVTLSFAQRSTDRPDLSRQLAAGILVANALMPLRLLLVTSLIAPSLFVPSAIPMLGMVGVVGLALAVLVLRGRSDGATGDVALQNPFEIGPALKFGALFGVVLFLAQVLQELFGDAGLYALSVLTGLTDVDAIGLAVASMVSDGDRPALGGMTLIALAAISNTVVKGGFVATLGSPQLRRMALGWFAGMAAAAGGGIALARVVL